MKLKKLLFQMAEKKGICPQADHDNGKSLKDKMLLLKMPSNQALTLTVEDMDSAEKAIIGHEQRLHFMEEIATLEKGKQCNKGSSLCKLDPIMDHPVGN